MVESCLLDVVKVQTDKTYCLVLAFENGVHRRFDMTPYLDE